MNAGVDHAAALVGLLDRREEVEGSGRALTNCRWLKLDCKSSAPPGPLTVDDVYFDLGIEATAELVSCRVPSVVDALAFCKPLGERYTFVKRLVDARCQVGSRNLSA